MSFVRIPNPLFTGLLALSVFGPADAWSDPGVGLHSSLVAVALSREHALRPAPSDQNISRSLQIEDFTYNLLEDGTKATIGEASNSSVDRQQTTAQTTEAIEPLSGYWQRFSKK